MKLKIFFLAMLPVLLISGCARQAPVIRRISRDTSDLEARIVLTDSAYALGSPIGFTMVVRNAGEDSVELLFANTCTVDFEIARDRYTIWRATDGENCLQVLSSAVLGPGDFRSFTATWDGVTADEKGVTLGDYEVRGILLSSSPVITDWARFYLVD